MKPVEVYEKEDAKLEATLSREVEKRDIRWTIGTTKISESLKYNIEYNPKSQKHILTIKECTLKDTGDYTIHVRNDKFTVKLLVKGI